MRSSGLTLVGASSALACPRPPPRAAAAAAGGGGGQTTSPPTFTAVYTQVLVPDTCTSHHAAGQLDSFLDLSTQATAYTNLVGAKASGPECGTSGEIRVVAGKASESLLFQKVSMSKPPCGVQMPFDGTPISSAHQALIEDWINGGAKND